MTVPLLDVKGLSVAFNDRETQFPAPVIKNIDFHLNQNETLGIIGESGSGKSITLLSLMGLIDSESGIVSGSIKFNLNQKIIHLLEGIKQSNKLYEGIRGKYISMIFQNPQLAFNPYYSIGSQINEMIRLHTEISCKKEAKDIAIDWLERVKMEAPDIRYHNNPHGLSGGMCQRAMIAMALASKPSILIADEPTTGLDATMQASIIDLLIQLKNEFSISMIVVSHNFDVIRKLTDRVIVYYKGEIIEQGKTGTIFDVNRNSLHPYTKQLLNASAQGFVEAPSGSINLPKGCAYCHLCPSKKPEIKRLCENEPPKLFNVASHHKIRCWANRND